MTSLLTLGELNLLAELIKYAQRFFVRYNLAVMPSTMKFLMASIDDLSRWSTGQTDDLANFLNWLGNLLGNRGCNDFDLTPFVEKDEALEIIRKFHDWNKDPKEGAILLEHLSQPHIEDVGLFDYGVCAYLEARLKGQIP
jgi:hypothetical protein